MDELESQQAQDTAPEAAEQAPQGGLSEDSQGAIPDEAAQAQQEHFLAGEANLDPTKLPQELQPIFKRMQGAYTKRMQDIAAVRQQAEFVDRLRNDRDFAFQNIAQWAAQNGYQIAPVGAQFQPQAKQAQPQQVKASAELVEQIKANLPPELQWMADSQAPAIQAAVQQMLQPFMQGLAQQVQTRQQEQAGREWDQLAEELSGVAPGWEEHEGEMVELLDFLQGTSMKSPKFGSKHQLLYNLVTGNAAATATVTNRMKAAAKNRPSSGITTGRTASNISDRIRQARTSQDAFRLAAQAAGGGDIGE